MTTPHSGIVLGCYNVTAVAAGIARRHEIWGVTDDSVVLPAFRRCKRCPSASVHARTRLIGQGSRSIARRLLMTGQLPS